MSDPTDKDRALNYLETHSVMSLATEGPEGIWNAAVFYVSEGFNLYYLSSETSRHSQNIATRNNVAITIQEDYSDWRSIKGLQMSGEVHLLDGSNKQHVLEIYKEKYTFLNDVNKTTTNILLALEKVSWYQLVPDKVYFVDNEKGFGNRAEITV